MKVIISFILLCLLSNIEAQPFIVDVGQYHKTPTMVHYDTKSKILTVNNIDVDITRYYVSAKFKLLDTPSIIFELIESTVVHEFEDPEWHSKHHSLFSDGILTIGYLTVDDEEIQWDLTFKHLGGNIFELMNITKSK